MDVTSDLAPAGFLGAVIEELKANGFVARSLERSGRRDAALAPSSG